MDKRRFETVGHHISINISLSVFHKDQIEAEKNVVSKNKKDRLTILFLS